MKNSSSMDSVSHSEQNVNSKKTSSKNKNSLRGIAEDGKTSITHSDVKMWHYFINDIYFVESGSEELVPYRVTINIKEKESGDFVYSFNAEKESTTRQTLHAAVNTYKGANGELFLDNSISHSEQNVNSKKTENIKPSARSNNMSTGQINKLKANYTHEKVYSKKLAFDIISRFSSAGDFKAKTREAIAESLWEGLNGCTGNKN